MTTSSGDRINQISERWHQLQPTGPPTSSGTHLGWYQCWRLHHASMDWTSIQNQSGASAVAWSSVLIVWFIIAAFTYLQVRSPKSNEECQDTFTPWLPAGLFFNKQPSFLQSWWGLCGHHPLLRPPVSIIIQMRCLRAQHQRKTQPEISCHREITLGVFNGCWMHLSRCCVSWYLLYCKQAVATPLTAPPLWRPSLIKPPPLRWKCQYPERNKEQKCITHTACKTDWCLLGYRNFYQEPKVLATVAFVKFWSIQAGWSCENVSAFDLYSGKT